MPMTRSSIAPCLTTAQLSNHKYLLRQFPTMEGLHAGLLMRPEKDEAKARVRGQKVSRPRPRPKIFREAEAKTYEAETTVYNACHIIKPSSERQN